MRLIDADALLSHETTGNRMGEMLVVGKGHILYAPAIDAIPIVHGKWVEFGYKTGDKCRPIKCSICENKHFVSLNVPYEDWIFNRNYCSECGAKMDSD